MKILAAMVTMLLMAGTAGAVCPDFSGRWVLTYHSTVLGDTGAGVATMKVDTANETVRVKLNEHYLGSRSIYSEVSDYTYRKVGGQCKLTFSGPDQIIDAYMISKKEFWFAASTPSIELSVTGRGYKTAF